MPMNENEIALFLQRAVDGQTIRVTLASGRMIDGIYNSENTSYETGLYFDTMEGKALRADWENVEEIGYRSARVTAGSMFMPDGHPLARRPVRTRSDGTPLKPYTTRNM